MKNLELMCIMYIQKYSQSPYLLSSLSLCLSPPGQRTLPYAKWASLIKDSFEHHFWIPVDRNLASQKEGTHAGYLHRTGIYKDCVGSTQRYANFQLRPNFLIAMVVAPELFSPENAWAALQTAEELLLGPLGMRTLDPG